MCGSLEPVGVLFALANACCATVFHLMTRVLARTESNIALLFYVTLVGAVVFAAAAVPYVADIRPTPMDVLLMTALGVFATAGHFLFAAAYREAPASLVAPVNYLHLVWAEIFGWIVFGHLPDGLGLAGISLIVVSGVSIALRGHLQKSRATKQERA